jgi:large subunit ribosomal protein L10
MRQEKTCLTKEYLTRLNASPFFIVVDYRGLKVGHMTELRKRLNKAGAEIHVVKNSIFRVAAKESGVTDLNGSLAGQLAVVTGQKDVSVAAKVVKTFGAEFDRLKIRFGYLNNQRLADTELLALADLPSIEVLRGQLLFERADDEAGRIAEHTGEPTGKSASSQSGQGVTAFEHASARVFA